MRDRIVHGNAFETPVLWDGHAGLLLFCLFGSLTTREFAECLGGMLAADMCRDHWVWCIRTPSSSRCNEPVLRATSHVPWVHRQRAN